MRAKLQAVFSFPLIAVSALGWGCEGHQMVALIARAHLTPTASAAVDQLLTQNPVDPTLSRYCQDSPADPMADAATWADDVKTTAKTGLWHFVNIPMTTTDTSGSLNAWCKPIGDSRNNKDRPGCVTNALQYELAILKDISRPGPDRADALRYIIHLVGDIHQPLHDFDNNDRGGNCTAVKFLDEEKPTNLHTIWDYKILESELAGQKVTTATYAHALDQRFTEEGDSWRSEISDPVAWAWEGHELAVKTAFGDLNPAIPVERPSPAADCNAERDKVAGLNIAISGDYLNDSAPVIDRQIARAGNRLATLLNQSL